MSDTSLVIEEALYGAFEGPQKGSVKDITKKIAAKVSDGHLSIRVCNALAEGDPAQNVVKELRVRYRLNGVTRSIMARENDILTIPMPSATIPAECDDFCKSVGVKVSADKSLLAMCEKVLCGIEGWLNGCKPLKVEIVSGYRISLSAHIRKRTVAAVLGGDGKGSHFCQSNIWEVIDADKAGNFEEKLAGYSVNDACHKCAGTGICVKCGGSGKGHCDKCGGEGHGHCNWCGGSGKTQCSRCDGAGIEKCPMCKGFGHLDRGANGEWGPSLLGSGRICPHCGGDGAVTCKACNGHKYEICHVCQGTGGKWTCSKCNGTGKGSCHDCHGAGKCNECGGSGRANYQWWIGQEELSYFESCIVYDTCIPASSFGRERLPRSGPVNMPVMFTWQTADVDEKCVNFCTGSDVAFTDCTGKKFCADEITESLWRRGVNNIQKKIGGNLNNGVAYKIVSKSFEIAKFPAFIKFTFEKFGVEGCLYIDYAKKERIDYELEEIRKERSKRNANHSRLTKVISLCAHLGLIAATLLLPYFFGEWTLLEYFSELAKPEWITGVVAYFVSGYAYWYFYGYVWCLAERKGEDGVWVVNSRKNKPMSRRLMRLLWFYVPLIVFQVLVDNVPNISQTVTLAIKWIGTVSPQACYYIASICLIRQCLVHSAYKWKWNYWVYWHATLILEFVSVALALWPVLFQEGTWLHDLLAQAIGYLEAPLTCIGLVIAWPLCILWKFIFWTSGIVAYVFAQIISGIINIFK